MNAPPALDALDLAALLCSRVCHDVISPVGAIVNGLEVLEEEKDEAMKKNALDLIRKSASNASARLQFARLAYGAAGSAGAEIDLGDAEGVARALLGDDRLRLVWNLPRALWPKNRVKLLLNLLLIATATIPRGGTLKVDKAEKSGFSLTAEGQNAKLAPAVAEMLAGKAADGLDAHVIQPYFAGLLARAAGLKIAVAVAAESVVLTAREP